MRSTNALKAKAEDLFPDKSEVGAFNIFRFFLRWIFL